MVCRLDRRSGEADERGVRQFIAEMARETVRHRSGVLAQSTGKAVLAAVGLVGHDDNIAPLGHSRIPRAERLG